MTFEGTIHTRLCLILIIYWFAGIRVLGSITKFIFYHYIRLKILRAAIIFCWEVDLKKCVHL